jgi:hypothetical protein
MQKQDEMCLSEFIAVLKAKFEELGDVQVRAYGVNSDLYCVDPPTVSVKTFGDTNEKFVLIDTE